MATLTVLKFETADGAAKALDLIKDLSEQHLINLHDAAIVPGQRKRSQNQAVT